MLLVGEKMGAIHNIFSFSIRNICIFLEFSGIVVSSSLFFRIPVVECWLFFRVVARHRACASSGGEAFGVCIPEEPSLLPRRLSGDRSAYGHQPRPPPVRWLADGRGVADHKGRGFIGHFLKVNPKVFSLFRTGFKFECVVFPASVIGMYLNCRFYLDPISSQSIC